MRGMATRAAQNRKAQSSGEHEWDFISWFQVYLGNPLPHGAMACPWRTLQHTVVVTPPEWGNGSCVYR